MVQQQSNLLHTRRRGCQPGQDCKPAQGGSNQHELYHGWLQHISGNPAMTGLHRMGSERIDAAAAWAAKSGVGAHWHSATGWCRSAGERIGLGLHAAWRPAEAMMHAAHALLQDSTLAVLPDEEYAALQTPDSSSQEAAGAMSSAGKGLQAAVSQFLGWGSSQDGGVGEEAAQPSTAAQPGAEEEAAPAQTHVLRWPLPDVESGVPETVTEHNAPSADMTEEAPLLQEASIPQSLVADSSDELAEVASRAEKGAESAQDSTSAGTDAMDDAGTCTLDSPCGKHAQPAEVQSATELAGQMSHNAIHSIG